MGDVVFQFVQKLRIGNTVAREFLAEFLGTFVLILFGDGAFAQIVLEGKGVYDVFAVVWGWGVGVMLAVATCGGITGGHVNPAVTMAFATLGKFPWKKVPHYIIAQHLGAFVASAVLYAAYYDGFNEMDPERTVIGANATAYIFATYPKPFVSIFSCFIDQIVGTGLLMFTVLAIVDKRNMNFPTYLHPILLGFMICALAMCYGYNCMAPLNPARDFATRAFSAIVYGRETFTHRNYWWVGVVGPHVGAIVGGWLYFLGIELHWPDENDSDRNHRKDDLELTMPLNSNRSGKI